MAQGYDAGQIVLGGDSAGGGLALALFAAICADGTAPAGAFVLSPWTDLTMQGTSLRGNAGRDPVLPVENIGKLVQVVADDLSPDDPRISPLFATFHNPPPTLFQVGSTEILLDDTRRMASVLEKAGGRVQVDIWPDCPHVWQLGDGWYPEARAALVDVATFINGLSFSSRSPDDS